MTAASLMEHTKLLLTTWFLASYPTAWLMQQKIQYRLDGLVQLYDAYLGSERTGGEPDRGSENKVPFVAAISVDHHGHSRHLKLDFISGITSEAISE